MRELEGLEGIRVGGRNIKYIRYADDTTLTADSEAKMQTLVNALVIDSQSRGLKANFSKTKLMVTKKSNEPVNAKIRMDGNNLEQVISFTYPGSNLIEERRCEKEIKTRTSKAKDLFDKNRSLVTNQSVSMILRGNFETFLYGCEACNISKAMEKWIEALEMWFCQRMLRVSYLGCVFNERVLQRAEHGGRC